MQTATATHRVSPEALVAIRKLSGLSQTALAEAAGIDRSQLYRIERGQAQPYDYTIARLALALKVPVSALLA